jgi:signal transduction histidine kinase
VRASILTRLTLWNASVLACLLVLFAAAGWITLSRAVSQRTATTVRESARAVAGAIVAERRAAAARGDVEEVPGAYERAALREMRVGDLDIFITADTVPDDTATENPVEVVAARQPRTADTPVVRVPAGLRAVMDSVRDERARGLLLDSIVAIRRATQGDSVYRVALLRVEPEPENREDEPPLLVAVMLSEAEDHALLRQVRTTLFFAIPLALLVSIAAGFLLARRSLAPLEAIVARTATITAANLDERLPVVNPHDELGRLTQIINGLLERVDRAFRVQRQFMADASHELRTPLAIVRGEAEVTLRRPHREEAEYREALGIVQAESLRLSRIVDDLLLLARTDAGGTLTARSPVSIADLVFSVLRSMRTLSDARGITLQADVDATLVPGLGDVVQGDEALLRRLLLNLLDNALKYAPSGSAVQLIVAPAAPDLPQGVRVRVSDAGPGIPAALRDRVFERFVHGAALAPTPVPTPSPTTGPAETAPPSPVQTGAGLGLAIAQAIAAAHGGRIVLLDHPVGTTFDVLLPHDSPLGGPA